MDTLEIHIESDSGLLDEINHINAVVINSDQVSPGFIQRMNGFDSDVKSPMLQSYDVFCDPSDLGEQESSVFSLDNESDGNLILVAEQDEEDKPDVNNLMVTKLETPHHHPMEGQVVQLEDGALGVLTFDPVSCNDQLIKLPDGTIGYLLTSQLNSINKIDEHTQDNQEEYIVVELDDVDVDVDRDDEEILFEMEDDDVLDVVMDEKMNRREEEEQEEEGGGGGGGGGSSSNTNTSGSNRSQTRGNEPNDLWLEIASISAGPLMLESVSSMCDTDKSLHLVQAKYLKMHDDRYKRLWFLWPSDSKSLVTGKCGCVGGCVFFGRNRNGQRFFKPSRQDLTDGVNIAAYRINDSKDPGFGQSILHEAQLVFHTPPYNSPDVAIHDYPPPSWGDIAKSSQPSSQPQTDAYPARAGDTTGSAGDSTASPSPASSVERRPTLPRRFSYNNASLRTINGVPYARLIDSSPTGTLPHKLDSESRLHTARSILSVPESGLPPKSSVSDSRLAVDYFVAGSGSAGGGVSPASLIRREDTLPVGSESEQSLYTMGNELSGTLPLYPRTVSLCSENQSDVFFSAEEELSHQLVSSGAEQPSRSGSLKLSLSTPPVLSSAVGRKRYGSDMNILSTGSATGNGAGVDPILATSATVGGIMGSHSSELGTHRRLSSYRSDAEIHSPEHRSSGLSGMCLLEDPPHTAPPRTRDFGPDEWAAYAGARSSLLSNVIPRSISPRLLASSLHGLAEADPLLMDSSDSISTTSFISAVSSQEDLALVNLHMQVNKPIIDSPLLMATYINHLSQISCPNWMSVSLPSGSDAFTVPLFQRSNDGRLVFIGSKYLPKYDIITEGFTCLKMITRSSPGVTNQKEKEASSSRTPTSVYPWDNQADPSNVKKLDEIEQNKVQEELISMRHESGTKTTVVIKMKGDIDIFITPLSLESLQRFIDALTPTLTSVHPLTVLNHLHMSCIGIVEAANVLKRDQYLSQLQGGGSKRSTAERKSKPGDLLPCHTYEESIASQVQGSIVLPKINIAVLQVSVVEEVIAFSALDNIRDLTCVSFLAVCLEGITARFHMGKESREIVQTFHRPTVTPSGKKNNVFKAAHKAFLLGHSSSNNTGQDNKVGEPVYIETSEKTQEETVITLHVSRLHMQLRRLQNQSSLLQEAVITAIPQHCSRAMFSVTKPGSGLPPPPPPPPTTATTESAPASATGPGSATKSNTESNNAATDETWSPLSEDKMGFIMMECGLEGVSFKVVKRAKFEREEDNPPGADPNSTTGKDITSTTLTKTNAKDSTQNSLNKAAKDNTNISNKANAKDTPQNSMNKANAKDTTHNSLSKANETSGESVESKPVRDDVSSETINIANVKAEDSSSTPKGTRAPATPGATSTTDNVSSTQPNPPNDTSKALVPVIDANASSCVIDVKSVWFNFAAPPRTPITRSKIAYTRLDWNLLSTASPGITAWMNPSNRCVIRAVHALRCRYRRSTAVVTCLMSQALDESSVHMPDKSRYGRFTPMAKALQEDPSCQLCNILRKYLLQSPIGIESNLKEPDLPHLSTLRQGVIVLSRQWKNILYTPLLLEHNFKIKNHPLKPMNVTFAIPDPEEEQMTDDPDDCDPDTEVTDECAMLLHSQFKPPHGIIKLPAPPSGGDEGSTTMSPPPHHQSSPTSPLTQNRTQIGSRKTKRLPPSQAPSSSRASIVFPLLTGGGSAHHHYRHLSDHKPALGGYASLKDEERLRCNAQSSNPSLYSSIPLPPAGPDSLGSLEQAMLTSPPHTSSHHNDGKEDLYAWMAKQQADTDEGELSDALSKSGKTNYWDTTKLGASSTVLAPGSLPPGVTAQSPPLASPDLTLLGPGGFSLYPMHDNLRLLDAHLIFEPLLASLGVMPQQMITNSSSGNAPPVGSSGGSLDSWGSNLSVSASMVSMRVDIVESEVDKMNNHATDAGGKKKEKGVNEDGSGSGGAKFRLDLPPDTGAFLCERVHIGCEVRRAADLTLVEDLSRQRRNMLYVSRGQLKKHANTALNVSVSVRYISQQVTMPLLRLLHQISNMYTNVKVTQSELRDSVAPPLAKSPAPPPLGGRLPSELFDKHKALVQQDVKPVVSPSASVRSKHQSFVQKLRSTSKSVRGYMNLGDPPPRDTLLPGSTPLTETRPGAPPLGGTPEPLAKPDELLPPLSTPRCWKTVYYLLDLYATMPETKTVAHRISMGAADVTDNYKINPGATTTPNSTTGAKKPDDIDVEKGDPGVNVPQPSTPTLQLGQQVAAREERARLIVFAVARIHRTRLLATLSGLKLEAEITNLHSSLTYRKKTRPPSLECSLTGHLGRTMIVLLEGVAPNQQTVVKVTVDKSQALISSLTRRSKDKNSGFITIDRINIDIPQHPVVLHGMMTRGSKQLSSTLQELRVTRTSSRMSRGTTIDEVTCSAPAGPDSSPPNKSDPSPPHHKEPPPRPPPPVLSSSTGPTGHSSANVTPAPAGHSNVTTNTLLQPFVMHFTGLIQSVTFTAALLPSLQAQYRMDQLSSTGVTGSKAKFVVDLPRHSLSFSTKVQVIEANLPSEASIDLNYK
uniref:Uncharacterized protein KIAA1109 n=1 Tax=Cacopsylla melanoneura TaxID=428564 RepID=A0A8D8LL87_9HEMI